MIINIFLAEILRSHLLRKLTTIVIALPMAVACSRQGSLPNNLENSVDNRPVVLTTFTILADMARQVAGDRLQVRSITKQIS